jgi:hypothetical protein
MCLSLRVKITVPRRKAGYGWKVFRRERRQLFSVCQDEFTVRPRKKWLDAGPYAGRTHDDGWHIYLRKADVKTAYMATEHGVLLRVRYRGAFARGIGDGGWNNRAHVVVAKELYIL